MHGKYTVHSPQGLKQWMYGHIGLSPVINDNFKCTPTEMK